MEIVIHLDRVAARHGGPIEGESYDEWKLRMIRTDPDLLERYVIAYAQSQGVTWLLLGKESRNYWRARFKEYCDGDVEDPSD